MNVEIITLILRLVIVIVSCIVAPTVKHWLETSTENAKMESIREAAWSAVYANSFTTQWSTQTRPAKSGGNTRQERSVLRRQGLALRLQTAILITSCRRQCRN